MKLNTATCIFVCLVTVVVAQLFASPAATQNWVKDYVSTNAAGGVSKDWVKDYVSTNSAGSSAVSNSVNVSTAYSAATTPKFANNLFAIFDAGGTNAVSKAVDSAIADSLSDIAPAMNNLTNVGR